MTLSSPPNPLQQAPLALAPYTSMQERIALISRLLADDFGLHVHAAFELEFYLQGLDSPQQLRGFENELLAACREAHISVTHYGAEDGPSQYEIALKQVADPVLAAQQLDRVRHLMRDAAEKQGGSAVFDPKPSADQPGSGLHLHISLHDGQGKNTFFKNDHDMSQQLEWSIGGLLNWAPHVMPAFAPHAASYARFAPKQNAPTTVSWGANNRTVAVRLPMADHNNKHIELRLAGSDADAYAVLAVALAAVHDGLTRQLPCGQQIFGDASLDQYDLPKLPTDLKQAVHQCRESDVYQAYFTTEALLTVMQ